jgi:hypothetical protein
MATTPDRDLPRATVEAFKLRAAILRRALAGRCVGDSAELIRQDRDAR